MSGGSYNYLCHVLDIEDLMSKRYALTEMAERLEGLSEIEFPGSKAAAVSTRMLLLKLDMWETHTQAHIKLLSPVWKAVEWWDSNDWGPEHVREELDKLVGGT